MKLSNRETQFELPRDLHQKLIDFRNRVWSIKTAEGAFAILALGALCYLAVFILDRWGETPSWLRATFLLTAMTGVLIGLPLKLYRWVWRHRHFSQLARLLSAEQPRVGDRLLGVVNLVQNRQDQHASPALCRAAIQQVADDTRAVDFSDSVPRPRHRTWGAIALVAMVVAVALFAIPGAGLNAFKRWLHPWADIPRYTFTQLNDMPAHQVVATGEPFELIVPLSSSSVWKPETGLASYGDQPSIVGELSEAAYTFKMPPQTEAAEVEISIGDARERIRIKPKNRPELTGLLAHIRLPAYLGSPDQQRDVRSGAVSAVKGSTARFDAEATRPLAAATVNGREDGVTVDGVTIRTLPVAVNDDDAQEFRWTDIEGLSAKSPFKLRIRGIEDRAPSIQCSNLPAEKVLLDEETLAFNVTAADDFGVKVIGVEWAGIADPQRNPEPDAGEYLLASGSQDADNLVVAGTFSPKRLGIRPQPVHLRVYTEDYFPKRKRVYSPVFRFYVLDRQQHMIWVTQQLEQWERQALEVRDEEQRLLHENSGLLELEPSELDSAVARKRIAKQAASERANAARLAAVTLAGEQLVSEAARNPEFNVETLENWAQVMKALKALAKNNMPSVASRLGAAANASKSSQTPAPPSTPRVSDSVRGAAEAETDEDPSSDAPDEKQNPAKGGAPLGLVQTTLMGGKSQPKKGQDSPASQDLEQAVEEQQQLLAEFNRVMDELKEILQNLQGSTFVKRLKAAADAELGIAADLHERLQEQFGVDSIELGESNRTLLQKLYAVQTDTARDVRLIQEDLSAYFDRTRRESFKAVRDEMQETEVVRNFKGMTELLNSNHSGDTIAQAEFWSDRLDRWAEMLVGPANSGGGT